MQSQWASQDYYKKSMNNSLLDSLTHIAEPFIENTPRSIRSYAEALIEVSLCVEYD